MIIYDINLLGIFIGTVVYMIVGAVWYSPSVFGSVWAQLSGMNINDEQAMKQKRKGAKAAYVGTFFAAFLMASVLSYFFKALGTTTILSALSVTLLFWLGFVATTMLIGALFSAKPAKLYLIDVMHQLVAISLMGAFIIMAS